MTQEQLILILKENKGNALRGIEAANMTVWEWADKGTITKEMAHSHRIIRQPYERVESHPPGMLEGRKSLA